MPRTKDPDIALSEFLDACTNVCQDTVLSFANVGKVEFTTLTRANLELLRWATATGAPGIIISCPDFERESLATAFLGAFQHLIETSGDGGAHEPVAGERVAIGECVVEITKVEEQYVIFKTGDSSTLKRGLMRDKFPLVHRALPGKHLSRIANGKLSSNIALTNGMSPEVKEILDKCGNDVPAIGYITSPSQYLNEAPTRILSGNVKIGRERIPLSELLPITYLPPNGKARNGFRWPFDVKPSLLVCPRTNGTGIGYPLLEYYRNGGKVDFVSLDIPGPELLNTNLLADILDLADEGIGIIGFCDRWTLDKIAPLKEQGFLVFDWDNCQIADKASHRHLSRIQRTMRSRHHEIVFSVSEGNTGLSKAKDMLYDKLDRVDLYTEDALRAKSNLFRAFSSAIRRSEIPNKNYCFQQLELIDEAIEIIEETRLLASDDYEQLCVTGDILKNLYKPGVALPKEEEIFNRIADALDGGRSVILVVDRSRTEEAYRYWCGELIANGYLTNKFKVLNTLEFMAEKGVRGNEYVLFSGWYDRGTMDRALHSGIASDIAFVLYNDGAGGLEIEWYRKAKESWRKASDRCARQTDSTLHKLGLEKTGRLAKSSQLISADSVSTIEDDKDESPTSVINNIERDLLRNDVARTGERSVAAVPVLFDDGSHIWLRAAGKNHGQGGTLIVITDCLVDQDDEPERKPASAVLRGDVVLRTHSNRDFIRRTSEAALESYDDVRAIAERWRAPIARARKAGMRDSDIVEKLRDQLHARRSDYTLREWVVGNRIAPRRKADIKAVFEAFGEQVKDEEVELIMRAAGRIRGQHMSAGSVASEIMVKEFLEDVRLYGVDDAVERFEERHDSGRVELLSITAVGKQMQVSAERVAVY